ncbi:MAG: glycosyltransferase [Bdellovibrionota bacterium]
MAHGSSQTPQNSLASRMRDEWDRRVGHDYRYWMSDGVATDEEMWAVGRRDFEHIVKGLGGFSGRDKLALEIGCGVGRLLRAASTQFQKVIGIDISHVALEEAKRLLSDVANVELQTGNGSDLQPIADESVDFVYSFAALGSMPVQVFAGYLLECNRVLKGGGIARLQIYLGHVQPTFQEDTIALRSYERDRFSVAATLAGFSIDDMGELVLPFQVSDHEAGLVAHLVTLRKIGVPSADSPTITDRLVPSGEPEAGGTWVGSETEYLMALSRAKQHMDAGRISAARQALEYAVRCYAIVDEDVKKMLEELRSRGPKPAPKPIAPQPTFSTPAAAPAAPHAGHYLSENLAVLRVRFPQVADAVSTTVPDGSAELKFSVQGLPIVVYRGTPLIHMEKPDRAAERWAEQTLNTSRVKEAPELLVSSIVSGYQLDALRKLTDKKIHLFEPNLQILRAVLSAKDWRPLIDRVATFSVTTSQVQSALRAKIEQGAIELVVPPQSALLAGQVVDELRRALVAARGIQQLHPRIAVVGPMYGGSLPIARYTARALAGLKQRATGYDLSPFFTGFKELGGFLRTKSKKEALESQYVELLSQTILEGVTERPIDILICLAQAPMTPTVLQEMRKRGVITVMWFVEDCGRFPTWQYLAPYFDYMFLIQKDEWCRKVEAAGAGRAIYLPVGCDPDIHAPIQLTHEERLRYGSDISFLGAGYNNRRHMFAHLANRDFKIWGTEWPDCMPFSRLVQERGRRLEPEEYVKIFNATKINLNLHSSTERDGVEPFGDFVNPRTFELAACGAFQLVDERSLLGEQFAIGKEAAVFHDGREMQDKIDYYLEHPEERAQITQAARNRVFSEHTYQHRLKSMLEYIYADRYEQLKANEQTGSWGVVLREAQEFPELEARLRQVYERGEDCTFDAVLSDIQNGKGALSEMEQRLLFLHHIRSQITTIKELRNEKE